MGTRSPCIRIIGGTPTARCRSEQPCATASLRKASILAITPKATRKRLVFRVFGGGSGHKREVSLTTGQITRNGELCRRGESLQEFLERHPQFIHGLRSLGLVQRHALHH